jgi:Rad3-related DNA helicase
MTDETPLHPPSAAAHGFFPFPEIRPAQMRALDAWTKSMEKDKRFAVFELPTGVGKSGLAFAIGSWAHTHRHPDFQPGGFILTTQKSLQQQYLRDFADRGMVELKGAANYSCETLKTDCKTGKLLHRTNKTLTESKTPADFPPGEYNRFLDAHPTSCDECPYDQAKAKFAAAPLGVTNFTYLLSEAKHVKRLRPRSILIIDEAHNTESQLLGFVEIEITGQRAEQVGAAAPPRIDLGDVQAAREYVLSIFWPALKKAASQLEYEVENETDGPTRQLLSKRLAALEQFGSRMAFLAEAEAMGEWFAFSDEKTGALKLRPLTARSIAQDFLFRMGHKLLFMSATILDGRAFIRGLGLPGSEGGFLRVDSDFPVKNRLINIWPAGSMSYKNVETTTPKLVRYIEKVLDKHKDDKGIIHTHSYKLTQAVIAHLQTTKHSGRLVTHDSSPGSREMAVQLHVNAEHPTVLISPSMTEGLDLSEELSRFQVISKMPYPYLGDPFTKARMDHDPSWYGWQTALTLVQATGRSIRSASDSATTYILDADFDSFMARNSDILPQWWKDAIVYR